MSLDLASAPLNEWIAEFTTAAATRDKLVLYAEASGDLNPLHLDPDFARKAGFDDVIVHGMYGMAQLGRLLTRYFPVESILSFSARFGAIIPVDSLLHCRARVVERSASEAKLALEALISGPAVASATVAISGTAIIALNPGS